MDSSARIVNHTTRSSKTLVKRLSGRAKATAWITTPWVGSWRAKALSENDAPKRPTHHGLVCFSVRVRFGGGDQTTSVRSCKSL